jgi:hypothetical protein
VRTASLLLVAVALAQTGCSALVANGGEKLIRFTSRAQVHDAFGPPVAVTAAVGGGTVEEFVTRRKIADQDALIYIAMLDGPTLGLAELYLFPREVFVAARRSVLGQRLRVEFDDAGGVVQIRRDGEMTLDTRRAGETPAGP